MQMRPGGIAHYCAPYLGALCLDSITPDDLAHYPLGSVLNGGN